MAAPLVDLNAGCTRRAGHIPMRLGSLGVDPGHSLPDTSAPAFRRNAVMDNRPRPPYGESSDQLTAKAFASFSSCEI